MPGVQGSSAHNPQNSAQHSCQQLVRVGHSTAGPDPAAHNPETVKEARGKSHRAQVALLGTSGSTRKQTTGWGQDTGRANGHGFLLEAMRMFWN